MGGSRPSKLRYNYDLSASTYTFFATKRVHVNILVVGDKGAGKTTLLKRANTIIDRSWIHLHDTDTTNLQTSFTKAKNTYEEGIDVSGLSIVTSNLPLHGIIWVIDATKIESSEDIQKIDQILELLYDLQGCVRCIFFSHTDVASETNMKLMREICAKHDESIFYAPLTTDDKDASFTILQMIKKTVVWIYNTLSR